MNQSMTVQQALQLAIDAEIKAYNLYMNTSKNITGAGTKAMLVELANQELGHRKLLENVVRKDDYEILEKNVPQDSQGISDFLVVSELDVNATPQDVMIFAMREEQKAFNFYTDLQNYFAGSELENLFSRLAAEEQQHKIKLENEYDEHFLKDN